MFNILIIENKRFTSSYPHVRIYADATIKQGVNQLFFILKTIKTFQANLQKK